MTMRINYMSYENVGVFATHASRNDVNTDSTPSNEAGWLATSDRYADTRLPVRHTRAMAG